MIRALIFSLVTLVPVTVFAAGGGHLDKVDIDVTDTAALKRGAKGFVEYCLSCHSASMMRYKRVADDLGISDEEMTSDYLYAGNKLGDMMKVAMPADAAERWFGTPPPDLSVISRARGTDWLYTYLRSFYLDPSRPTGVNNLAFKDVAMPHVLWELQGLKAPVFKENEAGNKVIDHLEQVQPGRLSEEEYDAFVKDLVTFLAYLGEPAQLERARLGGWVLAYLAVFLVIAYLLKREFWKDVH